MSDSEQYSGALVTYVHHDVEPLVSTLWNQSVDQLLAHLSVVSSTLYFTKLATRTWLKAVLKLCLSLFGFEKSMLAPQKITTCVSKGSHSDSSRTLAMDPLPTTALKDGNNICSPQAFGNLGRSKNSPRLQTEESTSSLHTLGCSSFSPRDPVSYTHLTLPTKA